MAEISFALTSTLLPWLLWTALGGAAVLAWSRIAGDRRAAAQAFLIRAFAACQLALLALCAGITLAEHGAGLPEAGFRSYLTAPPTHPRPLPAAESEKFGHGRAAEPEPPLVPGPAGRSGRPAFPLLRANLGLPAWVCELLLCVYALGLAAGLVRLARDLRRISVLQARARAARDPHLTRAIRKAAGALGVKARVRILVARTVPGILLAGWRRPAILIRPGLAGRLEPAQLEALFTHELAHHRRHDVAWQRGLRFLSVLAWPIPVNRWLARRMRAVSEILSDRLVLQAGAQPEVYAGVLAEVAIQQGAHGLAFAAPASLKSLLRRRAEMILASRRPSRKLSMPARCGLLAAVGLLACVLVPLRIRAGQARPEKVVLPPAEAPSEPDEIGQLKRQIGRTWLERAIAAYRAGDFETARAHLRRAFREGPPDRKPHPLTDRAAALYLGPGGDAIDPGAQRLRRTSVREAGRPPLLLACVERLFGPLERERPGYWVDDRDGIIVQERALLEKIAAALLPPGRDSTFVVVHARLLGLERAVAKEWAAALGEAGEDQMVHRLTAEEASRLARALADSGSGIRVLSAPIVTCSDRGAAYVMVTTERSFIEKYRFTSKESETVPEPVLGSILDGVVLEIYPVVREAAEILLCLRASIADAKGTKKAFIEIPGHAERLPVDLPEVQRAVMDVPGARVRSGDEMLFGPIPGDRERGGERQRKVDWLWVKAEQANLGALRETPAETRAPSPR